MILSMRYVAAIKIPSLKGTCSAPENQSLVGNDPASFGGFGQHYFQGAFAVSFREVVTFL